MFSPTLARIILIATIFTQPAFADGVPSEFVPDPMRPGWTPSQGSNSSGNVQGPGKSNQPYRNWDVGRSLNGTPVVVYGGPGTDRYGRARIFDEPIGGSMIYRIPGSLDSYTNPDGPQNPPQPPNPDDPYNPPNPPARDDVPGPLGVFGACSAFFYSRRLRNRIKPLTELYDNKKKASSNT